MNEVTKIFSECGFSCKRTQTKIIYTAGENTPDHEEISFDLKKRWITVKFDDQRDQISGVDYELIKIQAEVLKWPINRVVNCFTLTTF